MSKPHSKLLVRLISVLLIFSTPFSGSSYVYSKEIISQNTIAAESAFQEVPLNSESPRESLKFLVDPDIEKALKKRDNTKLCFVLGTRPEIIKLWPVIEYCEKNNIPYFIIHTNQHYSPEMSDQFFASLKIAPPKYNIGRPSNVSERVEMINWFSGKLKDVLEKEKPSHVIVQGDTNSACSGGKAGKAVNIPVCHIEAGLRSYDPTMPEEHNRIEIDRLAEYNFCPTKEQMKNLAKENIVEKKGESRKILETGNTIVDAVRLALRMIKHSPSLVTASLFEKYNVKPKEYALLTLHRPNNVDEAEELKSIIQAIDAALKEHNLKAIFLVHPRTRNALEKYNVVLPESIIVADPVSNYFDMITLEKNARIVFTDSGGMQEETCVLGVPCVVLRENTERPEAVEVGSAIVAGRAVDSIKNAANKLLEKKGPWYNPFGSGNSSEIIIKTILGLSSPGEERISAKERFQAELIAELIEKRANYAKAVDNIYLDDLLLWKNSSEKMFEGCTFEFLPYEVLIHLADSNLVIRYFDPARAPATMPGTEIESAETTPVNNRITRQIARKIGAFPFQPEYNFTEDDKIAMEILIEYVERELSEGKVDLGKDLVAAMLVDNHGKVLSFTRRYELQSLKRYGVDAVRAEVQAIRLAEAKGFRNWEKATMYVTMEPTYDTLKTLTEFYGIKRIVYGIKDETPPAEIDRRVFNRKVEDIHVIECPDVEIRETLRSLLIDTISKRFDIPSVGEPIIKREYEVTREFREAYRRAFNEDIQVVVFDADLWAEKKDVPWNDKKRGVMATEERLMFRHLERMQMHLNPDKKHVLLIVGKEENAKRARSRLLQDRIFRGRETLIYNPDLMLKDVTERPILDMHIHSTYSDGENTPSEIIEKARRLGLKAISVTDHDSLDAYLNEPDMIKKAEEAGIELVVGSEISSITYHEAFDQGEEGGYFFSDLVTYFPVLDGESHEEYVKRLTRINKVIKKNSENIKKCVLSSFREFRKNYPRANLSYKELIEETVGLDIKNGFGDKLKAANGLAKDEADVFEKVWANLGCANDEEFEKKMDEASSEEFWVKLPRSLNEFAATLQFIIDEFDEKDVDFHDGEVGEIQRNTPKDKFKRLGTYILVHKKKYFTLPDRNGFWHIPSIEETVKFVKENGGFVLIAHPFNQKTIMKSEAFDEFFEKAISWGLDGIEAFSRTQQGVHSLSFYFLARKYNLIYTNGSDYHGPNITEGRRLATGYDDTSGNQTDKHMVEVLRQKGILKKDIDFSPEKVNQYSDSNIDLAAVLLKNSNESVLLRVPVEVLEGEYRESIIEFLEAVQSLPNGYVELFKSDEMEPVDEEAYISMRLNKKNLPGNFKSTRKNTITLIPIDRGEDISEVLLKTRMGDYGLSPEETIISPIGINYDSTCLLKSTFLGLSLMHIARRNMEIGNIDRAFVKKVLNDYKNLCGYSESDEKFSLTEDDIINLSTGKISRLIDSLKKLIRLLPITPLDPESIRRAFEHATEALIRA